MQRKLIVIVGPTASGKSALAVELARRFCCEIVSADSRQVYEKLDIGSGKITQKEMRGIPHHMLDIAHPRRTYTVAQYQKAALRIICNIWKRGRIPILCGGTGLYIRAVVDGLVIPSVKPDARLRKKLERLSTEKLFFLLKRKDPRRAAAIDQHNRRRLVRALEIVETLGKVPAIKTKPLEAGILMIGIAQDRKALQRRIHARLMARMRQGLVAEVRRLHAAPPRGTGLSWKRLESFGLEYRFISLYLQGSISKHEMVERLTKAIEHYAKRQMTWFKPDKRIVWVTTQQRARHAVLKFLATKTPRL